MVQRISQKRLTFGPDGEAKVAPRFSGTLWLNKNLPRRVNVRPLIHCSSLDEKLVDARLPRHAALIIRELVDLQFFRSGEYLQMTWKAIAQGFRDQVARGDPIRTPRNTGSIARAVLVCELHRHGGLTTDDVKGYASLIADSTAKKTFQNECAKRLGVDIL